MSILLTAAALCTLLYIALLSIYYRGWRRTEISKIHVSNAQQFLSVIIPARNEALRIEQCLESVLNQNYAADKCEVIVVDDHSEDRTAEIVKQFERVRYIRQGRACSGKKAALELGIRESHGEIIVTTDADCIASVGWLKSIANGFTGDVQTVTGPVLCGNTYNAFSRFQALDMLGMAMVTGGGIVTGIHHLANGANMAFRKHAFLETGGYRNNAEYASGDDLFLVQNIASRYPGSVRYIRAPEAVVTTQPMPNIQAFFAQRIRWATKNRVLKERSIVMIWTFIWLTFVMNFLALIAGFMKGPEVLFFATLLLITVALAQFIFLRTGAKFYGTTRHLMFYPMSFVLHYLYVLGIGIATLFVRNYQWKGRRVR